MDTRKCFRSFVHAALGLLGFCLLSVGARGNDLSVSNITLTGQDAANDFILVQFDVAWDNSWRLTSASPSAPSNWDAAWIFIKFRLPGGQWQHATLNASGHTAVAGSTIDVPAGGTGVFIYRSTDGLGPVGYVGVQLRWNYGLDGLVDDQANVEVTVVGIEMVYVPEGEFAVGSGGTAINEFTLTTINTAAANTAPAGVGSLGGQAGGYPTGQTAPVAAWPNGFEAFYAMKYEISQGQYADFLNMLSSTQAATRTLSGTGSRFTIGGTHPNFVASAPDRACNFIAWSDGVAYADWAGLRPMTELEFEKASRGTLAPVADEYAWGTTSIFGGAYSISNDGLPDATVSNAGFATGNAAYSPTTGGLGGPLRVGIFSASFAAPIRSEAGATFYGIMEMSGNVMERAVTLAATGAGFAFTGTHGDGALTAAGEANVATWPPPGIGAGYRGGAFNAAEFVLRISDRVLAASAIDGGSNDHGFRAVRSAQ